MAINFSGYPEHQNQNTTVSTNTSASQGAQQTTGIGTTGAASAADSLTAGQVFSGEVVGIDGKEIQLLLGNNQTLSAKLDGNLSVSIGQILSFEVKSTANHQTALRPLYANLTQNPAVSIALKEAGMPATGTYVSMVSSMMEEGMPVNRNALWSMAKGVNAHPTASPETLVQLTKLNLPINELTINQFENYKNFEHQIIKDAVDLSEGLAGLPKEAMQSGNPQQAVSLADQILQMLDSGMQAGTTESAENISNMQSRSNIEAGNVGNSEAAGNNGTGTTDNAEMINSAAAKLADNIENAGRMGLENTSNTANTGTAEAMAGKDAGLQFISEKLSQLGLGEAEQQQLMSGEMSGKELLSLIKTLTTAQMQSANVQGLNGHQQQLLQELLGSKEFTTLVKDELLKQFVLNPQDIEKEGKVEELYKRIAEQSAKAIEILQTAGKDSGAVMKSAQNLSDNVNFMNQLNQMMTYVQLPLRMNQENTHGELYVYTNKKNLAKKDGNVSALLHLEMEHLGTMDVYVAMQNSKVSTHFYMQDEATLDFIEQHISLLDERLAKKGYDMKTTVTVKEQAEQQSIAKEFLKNDSGTMAPVASKLSFDVRA